MQVSRVTLLDAKVEAVPQSGLTSRSIGSVQSRGDASGCVLSSGVGFVSVASVAPVELVASASGSSPRTVLGPRFQYSRRAAQDEKRKRILERFAHSNRVASVVPLPVASCHVPVASKLH